MGLGSPPPLTWSTIKCRHVRCLHYGFSMCGGFTVHMYIYCSCSTCTPHTTRVPCTQHVYCTCVSPADYTDTRRCSMKVSAKVYTCLHTTRVRLHVSADYTRVLGDCRRRCSCWSRDPVPAPRLHCSALSAAARPAQSWPDRAGGGCWLVSLYTGYHQVTYTSVQQAAHP